MTRRPFRQRSCALRSRHGSYFGMFVSGASLAVFLYILGVPSWAEAGSRDVLKEFSNAFSEVVDEVNPSVVSVYNEQVVKVPPYNLRGPTDLFRYFFGDEAFRQFHGSPQGKDPQPQERKIEGLGSGVIVSDDGYILTNNHVVKDATKLTVTLQDGTKYTAKVVGTDPPTEVAVIKIDGKNLPAAKLGDSDELKVGEWVIAIGNPFHLIQTVTQGIISAKGRANVGLTIYEDFLQTDAAINPGNSGGALTNLDGEVVGINTAIATRTGGYQGVGFAIPINMARNIMDKLITTGKVRRGFLSIIPQDVDENLAKAFGLESTTGALVGDVTPDGPADRGGMRTGDVIVEYDGHEVNDSTHLRMLVADTAPDTKVSVVVLREGKRKRLKIVTGERDDGEGEAAGGEESSSSIEDLTGLNVTALTRELALKLGLEDEKGVVVNRVKPASPADEADFRMRDLIIEINHERITGMKDYRKAIRKIDKGETALFRVKRGEYSIFLALSLPED